MIDDVSRFQRWVKVVRVDGSISIERTRKYTTSQEAEEAEKELLFSKDARDRFLRGMPRRKR